MKKKQTSENTSKKKKESRESHPGPTRYMSTRLKRELTEKAHRHSLRAKNTGNNRVN